MFSSQVSMIVKISKIHWNWLGSNYQTPKNRTTLKKYCKYPKIWTMWLCHTVMCPKDADKTGNSVGPDQTNPESILCTELSVQILRINIIVKELLSWSTTCCEVACFDIMKRWMTSSLSLQKAWTKVGAAEQNNVLESIFHKIMHQKTSFHQKWRLPHGGGSREKPYSSRKSSDGVPFGFLAYPTRFSAIFICSG